MKLTKSKLQQIIKEELGGLQEQSAGSVWVLIEPVYGAEDDAAVRIVGIYTTSAAAAEAEAAVYSADAVVEVPLNKYNDDGFHPYDGPYGDDEED